MTDDAGDERSELTAEARAALTPEGVRAGTRARLLARAAADAEARGIRAGTDATPQVKPALTVSRGRGIPAPLFGAVALALAASLVLLVKVKRDAASERSIFAATNFLTMHRVDSLTELAAERDRLFASLTGPQVRVVGLNVGQTANPRALMFWDQATDRWTFIAHNLAQLKPGRTYELWLVTASQKIPAGTFNVSPGGDAFIQARYALDKSALKAIAVTEEPAGGVAQPTGAMVVAGTAGAQ